MLLFAVALAGLLLAPLPALGQAPAPDPIRVSIIQLIATPEKFDGKYVMTSGFVHAGFESNAVYLHRDDFTYLISSNGLWLTLDQPQQTALEAANDTYYLIAGTFDASNKGHWRAWSGSIKAITRLEERWFPGPLKKSTPPKRR